MVRVWGLMSLHSGDLDVSFRFGAFLLNPRERLLIRDGEPVSLTPKAFEVLLVLVSRAGHLVRKDELLKEVWPGAFVEEGNLSYTVSLLRRALEVEPEGQGYIATVQKIGYRFTAPVHRQDGSATDEHTDEAALTACASPTLSAEPRPPGKWPPRGWGYTALAAAALVLGIAVSVAYLRGPVNRPSVSGRGYFNIVLPPNVEEGKEPSVSPDGRLLVMAAGINGRLQLALRRLDSPALIPIAGTEGGWMPFWSPDSRSLAFLQGRKLKRVDLSGGSPTEVCDVAGLAGADWNHEGVILFGDQESGAVYRVPSAGGTPVAVTLRDTARGETAHRWPRFLPDGQHFFYTTDGREGGLYIAALDGTATKRILPHGRAGQYAPPGYVLFLREQTLMAQPFDARSLEIRGEPLLVANNVGLGSVTGTGFSVSRTGTIVYRPAQGDPSQLVWFGRDGSRLAAAGPSGSYRQVALSPSGRTAAVSRRDTRTGNLDLYTLDLTSGVLTPQTSAPGFEGDPVWSPDERALLFTSNRSSWMRPFKKDLVTGTEEPLLEPEAAFVYADDWTPDGRIVLRSADAWYAVSAAGRATPQWLTATPPAGDQLHVSPTGRWVAFESNEAGQAEVYVATFPDFTGKRRISLSGGTQPLWRSDGREIFYLNLQGVLTSVELDAGDTAGPRVSAPRPLFETPLHPMCGLDEYGVTADGQRFLIIEKKGQTITILMDWLVSQTPS